MDSQKIILINILSYLLVLLIFIKEKKNLNRFLLSLFLYLLFSLYIGLDIQSIIIYLVLSVICVLTESFFVNFLDNTWEYKKPDVIGIPYWLVPLWGIAILLIVQFKKLLDIEL